MELVEHIGSGLKRMREELQQDNLPEPVLDVDENWFSITFIRKVLGLQESSRKKLEPIIQSQEIDETREKILNLIQE